MATVEEQIELLVSQYARGLQNQGNVFSVNDPVNQYIIRELVELGDVVSACTCLNLAGLAQSQLNFLVGPTIPRGQDVEDTDFNSYIRKLCVRSRLEQIFEESKVLMVGNLATVADVFFFLDNEKELTTPYRLVYAWCAHYIMKEDDEYVPTFVRQELAQNNHRPPSYEKISDNFESTARMLYREICRQAIELGLDRTYQGWSPPQKTVTVSPKIGTIRPQFVTPKIQVSQPSGGLTPLGLMMAATPKASSALHPAARFYPNGWVRWTNTYPNANHPSEPIGEEIGIILSEPSWVQYPAVNQQAGWHYYILRLDPETLQSLARIWVYESHLTPFDPNSVCCSDTEANCVNGCWVVARRLELGDEVYFENADQVMGQVASPIVNPQIRVSGTVTAAPKVLGPVINPVQPNRPALQPQIRIAPKPMTVQPRITISKALPSDQLALPPDSEV